MGHTVEPVYYGHLRTRKKCPDYQGVLIFQVVLYKKYHLGPQLIGWIMQVSIFSSIHINRFHCTSYISLAYGIIIVTGFAKTKNNGAKTEIRLFTRHKSHTLVLSRNTIDRATYSMVCFYCRHACDLINP